MPTEASAPTGEVSEASLCHCTRSPVWDGKHQTCGHFWCMRVGTHGLQVALVCLAWIPRIRLAFEAQVPKKQTSMLNIPNCCWSNLFNLFLWFGNPGQHSLQNAVEHRGRSPGLTGRLCIVAETARDLQLRDGGVEGSVAREVYGADRSPAPSIRTLSKKKNGRAIFGAEFNGCVWCFVMVDGDWNMTGWFFHINWK